MGATTPAPTASARDEAWGLALVFTLTCTLTGGCGEPPGPSPVTKPEVVDSSPASPASPPTSSLETPRLILHLTVDQLRGDLLERYRDRLGGGGLRYLLDHGTVYADAHHRHANNETIVGHATLATGADPAQHGMVANRWFDREAGRSVYCVEALDHYQLRAGADADPTQGPAKIAGRSPDALLAPTFSDALALHYAGRAKLFAVSVKDRAAVSMAGHAGQAYWFSKQSRTFVTSSYYSERYPDWVTAWTARDPLQRYDGAAWELSRPASTYLFGDQDDVPWETPPTGFGRAFPHPYGAAKDPPFTTLLVTSPAGDELTLDFSKALIEAEGLGQDEIPDYLAVSFSSTDYIGHLFGPSSLESEDNILRLDETVRGLLEYVDAQIGLERTLIVLSADHGVCEVPAYAAQFGVGGGDIDLRPVLDSPAFAGLVHHSHPYFYLDEAEIRRRGETSAVIEARLREALEQLPGVAEVVQTAALARNELADTFVHRAVLANLHSERSGQLHVVLKPGWALNDWGDYHEATNHGSPWGYDNFVPLIFAGPGIPAQVVHRRVQTVDVAPTLSALVHVAAPAAAAGIPLIEVMPAPR